MPDLGALTPSELSDFRRHYLTSRRTLATPSCESSDRCSSADDIGRREINSSASTDEFESDVDWFVAKRYGQELRNRHVLDFAFSPDGAAAGFTRFFFKTQRNLLTILNSGSASDVAHIFADPVAGEPGWHALPRPTPEPVWFTPDSRVQHNELGGL